jgi:parallel beta-helix repeat protein
MIGDQCYYNKAVGNTVLGINTITDTNCGVKIYSNSANNSISNNNVSNSDYGIYIDRSSYNNITSNNISKNDYGVYNALSIRNSIYSNNIIFNIKYGISFRWSSKNNTIYNNYFNNTKNAYDDNINIWNITKTLAAPGTNIVGGQYLGGNYWHDYTGVDDGSGSPPHDVVDGLGDTLLPYNSNWNIINGGDWHPLIPNNGPNSPIISGQINGKVGTSYPYTFASTDPDGNNVSYYIKWGDGNITNWTAFQASGTPYSENHTWSKRGTYNITAKAKDIYGVESDWGYLKVTMPKNQQSSKQSSKSLLPRLLQRSSNYFNGFSNIQRSVKTMGLQ